MKKLIIFMIELILIGLVTPMAGAEQTSKMMEHASGDFKYIILDDGTAEITKYTGVDARLQIPEELEGLTVTSIGSDTFFMTQVFSIIIPDSVKSIKDMAFNGCFSLYSVTIPDSVINVGENPFYQCNNLDNIIVSLDHPYLATIDGVLFSKPDKRLICYPIALKSAHYSIPAGIQIIGSYSFGRNDSLTTIIIPDSVKEIGIKAFAGCKGLSEINIPDSVKNIGRYAFDECSALTSIIIPDGVTRIEDCVFSKCTSLTNIEIPDSVTSIGQFAFQVCSSIKNITLPNSIMSIGDGAFTNCTSLLNITIPNSVISLGFNPFWLCTSLININVSPDHPYLANIDGVLFSKPDKRLISYPITQNLDFYSIPSGIRIIGENAFYGSVSLNRVLIPDSVTSIGNFAFYGCRTLKNITISVNTASIGNYAFAGCSSLTNIIIPGSVNSIGSGAFSYCESLIVVVSKDTYAEQFCKENKIKYTYPESLDWLIN